MILPRLVFLTLISFSFYTPLTSAESLSCKSLFANANPRLMTYLSRSLVDGRKALDPNWLTIVESLLKIEPQEFQAVIPKELIDPLVDHEGNQYDHKNSLNRSFKQGFLVSTTKLQKKNTSTPRLFHMTNEETAARILDTQELRLSSGAKNYASICLGGAGFPAYQRDIGKSVLLEVSVRPSARILDLTHTYGNYPGTYSRWRGYEWFLEEFVPKLIRGKYRNEFPELTDAVMSLKKSERDMTLSRIEAFAILMGAQLIKLTQTYESLLVDEYWVVDPSIVSGINQAR